VVKGATRFWTNRTPNPERNHATASISQIVNHQERETTMSTNTATEYEALSDIQQPLLLMLSIQPRMLEYRQVAVLATEPEPLVIVQELAAPETVNLADGARAIMARLSPQGLQVALNLWQGLPGKDARRLLQEFAPLQWERREYSAADHEQDVVHGAIQMGGQRGNVPQPRKHPTINRRAS